MKGTVLIVVGAIMLIFVGMWIGGVLPLEFVAYEIRTCPSDGSSYGTLEMVTAITPKSLNLSKITVVSYFQDETMTASLVATEQNSEYLWTASIVSPSVGSHKFKFVFQGVPLGDINNDGVINEGDRAVMESAWFSTPSDSNWNPDADLDEDGKIDLHDLDILAQNWGKHISLQPLATVSGTFTVTSTEPSEGEPEPELPPTTKTAYTYQLILQLTLLAVGCVLIGAGFYLEKKG